MAFLSDSRAATGPSKHLPRSRELMHVKFAQIPSAIVIQRIYGGRYLSGAVKKYSDDTRRGPE
jgi:hypothetical protein